LSRASPNHGKRIAIVFGVAHGFGLRCRDLRARLSTLGTFFALSHLKRQHDAILQISEFRLPIVFFDEKPITSQPRIEFKCGHLGDEP